MTRERLDFFRNPNLRVLNFTHIDLDGAVSAIVLKNFFKSVDVQLINYNKKEEAALEYLAKNYQKFDAVIFTDFCPGKLVDLECFRQFGIPVLVLDHHATASQWNDFDNYVFIIEKYCGAKLAYRFFEKYADLSHLTELVEITDDFDRWELKNSLSFPLNARFWNLKFFNFMNKYVNGLNFDTEDLNFFMNYKSELTNEIEHLNIQNTGHGAVVCDVKYVAEISKYIRENTEAKYLIMVSTENNKLSFRSDDIDLLPVLSKLGKGGGHHSAAGYYATSPEDMKVTIDEFINELELLC